MKRIGGLLATAAFILILAPEPDANGTVLFAGGEDVDFACAATGSCGVSTAAGTFRSNWAREAYGAAGSTGDPPGSYFSTPTFSPSTTIWLHAWYCTSTSCFVTTTSNEEMLRIIDSGGNATLLLRGTGTRGQLKISSLTTGGTFTDLVTCAASTFPAAQLTQIDLYINYNTNGEVALYANSIQICDFKGNVTNGDGAATLDQIEFGAAYSSGTGYWSEVIVATTDSRAMNLYTLAPNGNGNATQWTGSNPCTAILNATTISPSNYVYTGSNNQIEECTVTDSIPPGDWAVPAVVMSMNGLVGASGPQHFAFLTRIGSADYASSNFSLTNSFGNLGNYVQAQNPATSNPWSVIDLTAVGFNIGLESKP